MIEQLTKEQHERCIAAYPVMNNGKQFVDQDAQEQLRFWQMLQAMRIPSGYGQCTAKLTQGRVG